MFKNIEENKSQKIDRKIKEIQNQKSKAISKRVQQLQRQKKMQNGPSENIVTLKRELQQFRAKMKTLYTNIFQGSKQLSIRKSDLIKQIRGNEGEENAYSSY